MQTYLILGYGIPKKIETDDNYRRYLGIVFNTIFDRSQKRHNAATMFFCGGMTDMYKPYKRSEAGEMLRMFRLFADQNVCRSVTKNWKYLLEKKSLSTLENLIYTKQILDQKKISSSTITLFCEATRYKRINRLAKKIFGKAEVIAIDFDVSENRYIDPELIAQREKQVSKLDDVVLAHPERMTAYRKAFVDKIQFLRKAGPGNHQAALPEWWMKRLEELS